MKLRCPYCKTELTELKAQCPNCGKAMVIPGRLRKITLRQHKQAKERLYREFERKRQLSAPTLADFHPGRNPVVIFSLILILSVVGMMLFGRARTKFAPSKLTRTKEMLAAKELRNLDIAVERFNLDCHRYPTTEEGLMALINDPGLWEWRRPYVNMIRSDPWHTPYFYEAGTNGFTLLSFGPDRKRGTADDIVPEKPSPAEISVMLVEPKQSGTNTLTDTDTEGGSVPVRIMQGK